MYLPERNGHLKCGILDFQNAFIGFSGWDVFSLLENPRIYFEDKYNNELLEYFFNNTNQNIGPEKHRHNNNNNNKRHDTKNTRIRSKRKKNKQKNALKQQQQLSSLYTKKASKQNDIQISPRALREAYHLALRKLEINVDPQSRNNNNAS